MNGGEPGPDYWQRVWALRDFSGFGTTKHNRPSSTRSAMMPGASGRWPRGAARRRVDEALDGLLALKTDPVARVRASAGRAVERRQLAVSAVAGSAGCRSRNATYPHRVPWARNGTSSHDASGVRHMSGWDSEPLGWCSETFALAQSPLNRQR